MTKTNKDRLDPGFWIGIVLTVVLLYFTIKCKL